MKILAISGSARQASTNTALLRALSAIALEGIAVDVFDGIGDLPVFSPDREGPDLPQSVATFIRQISDCDGLLISSPEYVRSIPGGLKNAIDWLSRGTPDIPAVFGGRPFALIGASPGGFGTVMSQAHWLPVLKTLGVQLWAGNRLMVSRAGQAFNANGELIDQKVREQLAGFVRGFARFTDVTPR